MALQRIEDGSAVSCGACFVKKLWPITYAIEAVGTSMMKIGRSTDIDERMRDIQGACPVVVRAFAKKHGDFEFRMHDMLRPWRSHGEWFHLNAESLAVVTAHMEPFELTVFRQFDTGLSAPDLYGPRKQTRRAFDQRSCRGCGERGHNARSCTNSPALVTDLEG